MWFEIFWIKCDEIAFFFFFAKLNDSPGQRNSLLAND